MDTGITCLTFYNRMIRCFYYKEKNNYVKIVNHLFKRVFSRIKKTGEDFLLVFTEELNSKCFTGYSSIYHEHKSEMNNYIINCSKNIMMFINKYGIMNIQDQFNYKFRIKGMIDGITHINNQYYNLHFSYKNLLETQKVLDFYQINNYIYNICNNKDNNCLIMCVPSNYYLIIKYNPEDYTMKRGFISSIENNKTRKRGNYCISCKNMCEPLLVNSLNRLEMII